MSEDTPNPVVPAEQENTGSAGENQGVTRLAPSPTGALHLGNARTFVMNWTMARQRDWKVCLRIEDLDTPRVKPGAIQQTIELLGWLGLDWDTEAMVQSEDLSPYVRAMESLAAKGLVYPCELTRSEIEAAASAPQEGANESVMPRELRPEGLGSTEFTDTGTNWRFAVPDEPVEFTDGYWGPQTISLPDSIGDFVVWTKRGQPSYQLAVVIDDARQGVNQVYRGNDLLESSARQLALYRALGLTPEPGCWHVPLVRGPDGLRLAKRHGDTRLSTWKDAGLAPERVIGLIAWWCGIVAVPQPLSIERFLELFEPRTIPMNDVVLTQEAQAWLTA